MKWARTGPLLPRANDASGSAVEASAPDPLRPKQETTMSDHLLPRIAMDDRWEAYVCPECGESLTRWEITAYGRRTFCGCGLRWTWITGDHYIQAERR